MSAKLFGLDLGVNLPTFSSSSGWVLWVGIILVIILLMTIIIIAVWLWYMHKIYDKKIKIFENISGDGWKLTKSDTARVVKIGDGGEEVLLLRKHKVYRTAYGKKMGTNTYWFAKGQDGYWYNIVLGDLDAKMGMLDIEPIDRDLRLLYVAIRKNIQERYRKQSFMEKYGTMIMGGVFLLIMVVATWLLMSKAGDLIHEATNVMKATEPMIEQIKSLAGNLDKLCIGSGISPA